MNSITLGSTGITVPQNGFGALPIQRISTQEAVWLLQAAFDGGMRFFDTARSYSDSEEKVGLALSPIRDQVYIATKTQAKTPEAFWQDLRTSLKLLNTDSIDIYQFHCAGQVYAPGDGTGMYECMAEAKAQGLIRHIGITAHKIGVAEAAVDSGLYETIQYPFSYLASPREQALATRAQQASMGLIAMKGLAGGLIHRADAAMAFIRQFANVAPIWGIQRREELAQWLAFMDQAPEMNQEIAAFIATEREALAGEFCRGCGYCMPCPAGIEINNCARMSLMLRRAPSAAWLTESWQEKMAAIEHCLHCGACKSKRPYELDTPALLARNLADYQKVLAGKIDV